MFGVILLAHEADSATNGETIRFRARVQNIASLAGYPGRVIIADVDPKFALMLEITEVHSRSPDFAAKQTLTFGIHSPVLLFSGADTDAIVGRTFDFIVHRMRDRTYYFIRPAVALK